ncbi:MAG TPA: hypothetical protein VFE24_14080 [Pirellulales bacterium]|jgi:hypothetical protein|nr:hypothetical protein [Pirellulales bacterium]
MPLQFLPALAMSAVLTLWLRHFARPGVTDSGWFWLGIFSGGPLLGMLLIAPKYARREASIELKYIGRERAVPSGEPEVNGGSPGAEEDNAPSRAPTPQAIPHGALIVPLSVLGTFVAMVFVLASIKLEQTRRRIRGAPAEAIVGPEPTGAHLPKALSQSPTDRGPTSEHHPN